MEVSDSEDEAQTNSKTIEQKKVASKSKSSLKKSNWSKTKLSIDSISQLGKSEGEKSFDDFDDNEKESINQNSEKEKKEEKKEEKKNIDKESDKNKKVEEKPSFIYTFTWEEGGNEVKLIGSFSNWKNSYNMKRDIKDNFFKISLPLNNELYTYKFIVDGEWKYSQKQPIKKDDQGNINNFLDLTKFFMNLNPPTNEPKASEENKKIEENKKSEKKIKKKKSSKLSNKKSAKKLEKVSDDYSKDNYDLKELTEPRKNNVIGNPFNLDNESKQYKIGRARFYDFEPRNSFSSQKSYLNISGYRHNILEHILLPKTNNFEYDVKIGLSKRYRGKATTIIYYNTSSQIKI